MSEYSKELKEKQTKISNLKVQIAAHKKHIEEALGKKQKIEEECMSKFGIPLQDLPDKIADLEKEVAVEFERIEKECEELEQKCADIKE